MVKRRRLDAELVRRGFATSIDEAVTLIESGSIEVRGIEIRTPGTVVDQDASVRIATKDSAKYVSRGGYKLAGALEAFALGGLEVTDKRCLDAGASTGGFTDALLRAGAREVVAVDVGYGLLAWSLQTDHRVKVLDRTNVRNLSPEMTGGLAEITVADLSFIPLRMVLPALAACTAQQGDVIPMIKPQFEVAKSQVGHGGVIRDPALRAKAVLDVARSANELGFGVVDVALSQLPGPSGNLEFFLWLRRDRSSLPSAIVSRIRDLTEAS